MSDAPAETVIASPREILDRLDASAVEPNPAYPYPLDSTDHPACNFEEAAAAPFWRYWDGGQEQAREEGPDFFRIGWSEHYRAAVGRARDERKPLFVFLSRGTLVKPPC